MYKLMILIPPHVDESALDEAWPEFLHYVEQMPGLIRESATHARELVHGREIIRRVYEFYFPDKDALLRGMTSPHGEKAGQLIHDMTQGRATILIAEHKEDELENIRRSPKTGASHDTSTYGSNHPHHRRRARRGKNAGRSFGR